MNEYLSTKGWRVASSCSCSPKKYTLKNDEYPHMVFKTTPTRGTWNLLEYDRVILKGQMISLASQYYDHFNKQTA